MKEKTARPKLRDRYNFKLRKADMETVEGKSMTIEDDSFTIKEIIEKYTRGIDPMLTRVGHFPDEDADFDDDDLEALGKGDITDQAEAMGIQRAASDRAKQELETAKKQIKEKEAKKLIDEETAKAKPPKKGLNNPKNEEN